MPIVVFGLLFVLVGFGSHVGDPLYAAGSLIQRADRRGLWVDECHRWAAAAHCVESSIDSQMTR
jgi:hypothetical protein